MIALSKKSDEDLHMNCRSFHFYQVLSSKWLQEKVMVLVGNILKNLPVFLDHNWIGLSAACKSLRCAYLIASKLYT